jgi:hypothetical protein
MSLVLQSSGGGSVTLQEPVTANNTTLTVPSGNGSFVTADTDGEVRIGNNNIFENTLELGEFGSGDRNAFIDFHCSGLPETLDYSFRIIRKAGVNGDMELVNTGVGAVTFLQNNTEGMRINTNGYVLVGTQTPLFSSTNAFQVNDTIATKGYRGLPGVNGGAFSNPFNINWTGSAAQLWIDTVNIGNIAFSSDYRIKCNIETQTAPALDRVMQLRPVTYQMADYKDGLFKASEDIKEGFIAHEVQEVIPSGAEGVKDDETQIQSLRVDAILAVAVKAIQELKSELDAVKAELNELKGAA